MSDLEQRAKTELEEQKALQAKAITRIDECDKNIVAWNQRKAEAMAVTQQCNGAIAVLEKLVTPLKPPLPNIEGK